LSSVAEFETQAAKSEAFLPRHAKAHPAIQPEHPLLHLQRSIGNQGMIRMLRAHGSSAPFLQRKLTINEPGDAHEQEADRVADHVMRMPATAGTAISSSTPAVQSKTASPASASSAVDAPPSVHDVLRSPGQPLDKTTRDFMEPRFGQDFTNVRVHTDAKAAESARDVSAKAYTVGENIVFASGQYEPTTSTGKSLLAHELTHAVQQSNASGSEGQAGPAPRLQRQHESEIHSSPPPGVPFEKWGPSVEQMYRRNGLDYAANAVAKCRQGDCSKVLTDEEAYRAYSTGRLNAGMADPSQKSATSASAAPLVAGAAPVIIPGAGPAGAAAKTALERASLQWGTEAGILEGGAGAAEGGAAAASGATVATVAVPVVIGVYVIVAVVDLVSYANFQVALQKLGYVILPSPLQVCISGCHQPAAPTIRPQTPFFPGTPYKPKLPYAPLSPADEKTLRDWLDQQPTTGSKKQTQPTPYPTPQPAPQPKPKDKQQECFERLPYALPCEDEISMEEQVLDFIMRQGYSYESLGDCRLMGQIDKIDACNGGPAEWWHCDVKPYYDPISKKQHPGGVVSIFGCVCCRKDGETGIEWRGAHWSGGK